MSSFNRPPLSKDAESRNPFDELFTRPTVTPRRVRTGLAWLDDAVRGGIAPGAMLLLKTSECTDVQDLACQIATSHAALPSSRPLYLAYASGPKPMRGVFVACMHGDKVRAKHAELVSKQIQRVNPTLVIVDNLDRMVWLHIDYNDSDPPWVSERKADLLKIGLGPVCQSLRVPLIFLSRNRGHQSEMGVRIIAAPHAIGCSCPSERRWRW